MKAEPKRLDDDEPPWKGIRPPWARLDPKRHTRYLRDELGRFMCKHGFDCVITICPIYNEDCGEHDITICRYGSGCDNVAIKCEAGHSSTEVLEEILMEL